MGKAFSAVPSSLPLFLENLETAQVVSGKISKYFPFS